MNAIFVQEGDRIDYTPDADVAAGAVVVQNDLVGVTPRAIPANTLGSIAVEGVFDFPKASGPGTAIAAGVKAYWDADAQQASSAGPSGPSGPSGPAGEVFLGKTVRAAADDDASVRVRLQP